MLDLRRRLSVLCQQSTALAVVALVGLSAVGVVELEVVPPSEAGASGPAASAGSGGLSLVSAAPVEPTVRSVPLVGRATQARRDAERAGRTSGPLVVTSGAEEAPGYATVGVTWSGGQPLTEEDVQVAVRTRGTEGWSPWQEMPFDPDHGPEPAEDDVDARGGTDAVVVGDVGRVQARVTVLQGETPTGLELDIVDPGDEQSMAYEGPSIDTASLGSGGGEPAPTEEVASASLSAAAVQTAGVSAPKPQIFSRAQWGADESLRDRGSLRYGDISGGFVHHTVNANDYSRDQVPSLLRGIYAYHTRSLGWSDIGYNFLVDRFGRIWEGRYGGVSRPVVGAHTLGYNEDSFALSAIGNFETAQPSQVMLDAYAALFAWKLGLHGIKADDTDVSIAGRRFQAINGHRDAGSTACPGRNLYAKLGEIRRAGAALQSAEPPPVKPVDPVTTTDRDADLGGKRWPDLVARDRRTGTAVVVRTGGQLSFLDSGIAARGLGGADLVAAAGDLDGDGAGDLVARQADTGDAVLLRGDTETSRLREARPLDGFAGLDQLAGAGDLDGDGNADLVGRNGKGALRLFPGKGNGTFSAARTIVSSWSGRDLTTGAGDLDGDGRPDLVARSGADLLLFPGTGRGEVANPVPIAGRWNRFDLLSGGGDVTGDGVDDLVARVRATGATYVFPGDGSGGLDPRLGGWSRYAEARWLGVAGQLAGSGKPDLAVIEQDGSVRIHRHSGRTNLGAVTDTGIRLGNVDLLLNVGDWDGDGRGDFMTRRGNGTMMLYRGRGRATFAAPVAAAEGWSAVDLVTPLGDVTGDGRPDLLGQFRASLRVYPSDGGTGFRKAVVSSQAVDANGAVGVDTWDGDELADIVVRKPDGTLRVTSLLGSGRNDGSVVGTGAGRYDWLVGLGDVDGQARSDVVARHVATGDLWLLRGTRSGLVPRWRIGSGFDRYDLGG